MAVLKQINPHLSTHPHFSNPRVCSCGAGSWGKHGIHCGRLFTSSILSVLHGTIPVQLQRRAACRLEEEGPTHKRTPLSLTRLVLSSHFPPLSYLFGFHQVVDVEIPCTPGFSFAVFLSKPTTVRDWNIQGLPSDAFSTENGVIITRGNRSAYLSGYFKGILLILAVVQLKFCTVDLLSFLLSKVATDSGPSGSSSEMDPKYGNGKSMNALFSCCSHQVSSFWFIQVLTPSCVAFW